MALMSAELMASQFGRNWIAKSLEAGYPDHDELFKLIREPRFQHVRYRAALNRVDYELPDTFYQLGPESPSDCHWMIPSGVGALGQ